MATGIGETLRAARRRHGRSIADAAAETRVRESYLAALEEEDFHALGGDVYVKGFLRSYAKFLDLDPNPLIDAYRTEFEQDEESAQVPHQPLAGSMPRERRSGPAVIVVAAGALLLVLAAIGLVVGDGDDEPLARDRGPAPVETDPPQGETSPEPEDTPTTTIEPSPPPVDVEGVEVVLTVTGAVSWMRVQVDGETLLEGEQANGFTRTFTGEDEILMRIGDASAVSVQANGADQGSLGSSGDVVVVTCADGEIECDVEVVA
ncbi:MAG TPA: RodZ domain-containing protein [Egibacteraceae bacterium]|nr:RodZ domain-containing protein [Egibacteraceae bacterium]